MFERLILNEMFSFFLAINLLVPNQSGVKPGDSCINQYLSITHDVYSSFVHIFVILFIFIQIMDLKLEVFSWMYLKTSIKSDFLRKRKQTVTLNSQTSSWINDNASVLQESVLGPLLFLIYVNDLPDGLPSNSKLSAEDTSLFSVVHNINTFAIELNSDLKKSNDWVFQWKMTFNPDRNKQTQEIIFSRKLKKAAHPPLLFKNNNVSQVNYQTHHGVILDVKLLFEEHLKNILNKTSKTIGLLRKLSNLLP